MMTRKVAVYAATASLWLAMLSLAGIVVLTLYAMLSRAWGNPSIWALDTTSYMLCFGMAAAFPAITAAGGHVAVRLIPTSPKVSEIIDRVVAAICAVACVAALYIISDVLQSQFASGAKTMAGLQIPKWWLSTCLAYGFGTSALLFLLRTLNGPFDTRLLTT